jgi:hypothetical protein
VDSKRRETRTPPDLFRVFIFDCAQRRKKRANQSPTTTYPRTRTRNRDDNTHGERERKKRDSSTFCCIYIYIYTFKMAGGASSFPSSSPGGGGGGGNGTTTRRQSLLYIVTFASLFMLVALYDWENVSSSSSSSSSSFRDGVFKEDSASSINDLERVDSEKLSSRLEELREEKRRIEGELLNTAREGEEEEEEIEEDGMTPEKRKREYDENNFPEAIIENIERDIGHGARAQRGPEEPARTMELARLRCLNAPEPWSPFDAGRKKDNDGNVRGKGGDRSARRRNVLFDFAEEEEEEEETVEDRTSGRKLLAYRLPAGKYKPLQPKCAASERVKKSVRAGEDAIVGCLKTNRCSHAIEDVFKAVQNLDGIKSLKNYVNCIIVNGQAKGCGSISGNPETYPYIGTKPPPKAKKETTRTYKTCALVGNGPGLQRDGMGEIIDKHDAVIRFNTFVSSGVWQNYTGVKSTLRVFNKKRAETMKSTKNVYISSTKTKDKKDVENELWIFWNYMSFPFLPPVLRANKNTAIMAPDVIKYMVNGYFKSRSDLHRLGYKGFQCPTNVNSGIHAMYMAMQMCERVNLFGFSYSMDMLNKRNDARSPRMSRFHDWAFDTMLVRLLHLSGYVNVCTS